ncbi:nuclear transport factor 2 family protein [Hugenholtzia roseola]|uniref:nuclear transport factor 2 family protein n=1 Tax=Hugenholtzia roseola TaxID=1002 RepID=UPI00040D6145|nr:nuclear transport factor 2 family protein [Hugenholtzia roseola]
MKYLLLFLLALSPSFLQAQTDSLAIRHCISELFEGMHQSDTSRIKACFSPHFRLVSILDQDKVQIITDFEAFLQPFTQIEAGSIEERILACQIQIDGYLATVWTPYLFFYKEKLLHCGVNAFQLHKTEGGWKILHITDTRRKEGCE